MACIEFYGGLDKCLPEVDKDFDKDDIALLCNENDVPIRKQDDIFGVDSSVLDENKIPDFCLWVFQKNWNGHRSVTV